MRRITILFFTFFNHLVAATCVLFSSLMVTVYHSFVPVINFFSFFNPSNSYQHCDGAYPCPAFNNARSFAVHSGDKRKKKAEKAFALHVMSSNVRNDATIRKLIPYTQYNANVR